MKSSAYPVRRKKQQISVQVWAGLIAGFIGMMSCIAFGFYMAFTPASDHLKNSTPAPANTELPRVIPATVTSAVPSLSPPTLAPTWTPQPTFTPFVLISSNSVCDWMEKIVGEWESDMWGQIITFHPNGEYVQLDKKLVDFADTLSFRGTYECTSEGYIRMLVQGEEIFETSIVRVSIAGKNMKWTLVDDNDSDGHGSDITLPFVKK
jgi:hypothetical protein